MKTETVIEMPPVKKTKKNIPKEIIIHDEEGSCELAAELIFKYIRILMDPT